MKINAVCVEISAFLCVSAPLREISCGSAPHRLVADMSVIEIETAIRQLPISAVAELAVWLDEYYVSLWDQEIEDDLNAGRFDALLAEIDEEFAMRDLSARKPHHRAALTAIQSGKYASVLTYGGSVPSDVFAASKAKEEAKK